MQFWQGCQAPFVVFITNLPNRESFHPGQVAIQPYGTIDIVPGGCYSIIKLIEQELKL
jgi:hypothetical protein